MPIVTLESPTATETVRSPQEEIAHLRAELSTRDAELGLAHLKIKNLLHLLYGQRSEKYDPAQYQLLMEGVQPPAVVPEAIPIEAPEKAEPKRSGGGRRPLPRELPVKVTIIDVPEAERVGMVKIKEVVTEQLERAPARHFIHRIVRYVYARPDKSEAPVTASLPAQVYPQSGLGTSIIAHAAVSKYCDHLPLYRQERIAEREGVDLPRQKLWRAIEAGAHLLLTIERQLWDHLLAQRYFQSDETVFNFLDPGQKGKSRQGRFWVFHSPACDVVVARFDRSKGHEVLLDYIPPGWQGDIQSDAAKQYGTFCLKRPNVRHAGCMSHARRKWFNAAPGGGDAVRDVLLAIGRLYRVEREARQLGLQGQARADFRQSRRVPEQLAGLKRRIECVQAQPGVLPNDNVGKAASYALENWSALSLYGQSDAGHIEIDNNLVENSIRPIVLTRKNALFIGHPDAAWVSGVYMSVIGTCRRIGVGPEAYLNWVLPQLAAGSNHSSAAGLLPTDFKGAQIQCEY